jgi:hypothetical protein
MCQVALTGNVYSFIPAGLRYCYTKCSELVHVFEVCIDCLYIRTANPSLNVDSIIHVIIN